jgi:hypothetical protein
LTLQTAFFIDFVVKKLLNLKFETLVKSVDYCQSHGCLALSLVYFLLFNVGFVLIAAGLTALAVGSGGIFKPQMRGMRSTRR